MVFSPRKKETRPIQIQIFILTHYKKNLHLQSDLFINTIFIVTSSNSTCTSRPTCTFFFLQGLPALHPWWVNVRLKDKVLEV